MMLSNFADLSQNKRSQDQFNFDGSAEEGIMKKAKVGDATPSSVLHVRNLPSDATEQDLITIACPFGRVEKVHLLKGKTQALIQMQDVQSATALLQYYTQVQANIRSRPIYIQFSAHTAISATAVGGGGETEKPNHILLVSVSNIIYPITIDILHQIFSRHGAIHKIVIFNKKGFQALVQYDNIQSAQTAKQILDGQNIYSGCCTLKIQYSNLQNITVKFNNEKSRDYRNPGLPAGESGPGGGLGLQFPGPLGLGLGFDASGYGGYMNPSAAAFGAPGGGVSMGPTVLIASGMDPSRITTDVIFTLFGVYGDVTRVKILFNKPDTALVQFVSAQQAEQALNNLNQIPLHGHNLRVSFSKHTQIPLPREGQEDISHLTKDYTNSPMHRKNFKNICPPSPVLHLSNISQSATDDDIKNLFGQYGTIKGFKWFMKDRRQAWIELGSVSEAVEALINCHNFRLHDSSLRVSFSKSTTF